MTTKVGQFKNAIMGLTIMGFMDGNNIYDHPLFYKKIDMSFTCLNFIV